MDVLTGAIFKHFVKLESECNRNVCSSNTYLDLYIVLKIDVSVITNPLDCSMKTNGTDH